MNENNLKYINQVLDFYQNDLSSGFDYPVFREGNAEEMVLSRLERATKDEADDHLLHSRYAIWASSVNDLVDNAMHAVKSSNSEEALRQLELASSAIKAYRDIQTIFDNENFYKTSEIFKAYESHLSNMNARNSETISKEEIIKLLKKHSKIARVGLPRDIDISIENGILKVFIKNAIQNMQVNSSAFEGWILVLKAWLPNHIKYVELDFNIPPGITAPYGNPDTSHYSRFLYRLNNMLRLFPDWFFLHKSKTNTVDLFMQWIKSSKCVLNHSLHERESVIKTDNMERQIESWFVFEEGKEPLCKKWDIDPDKIFNQLPIGVFLEKIAKQNAIFTRGASAIDLWGIGNDRQTLHLVELKCGDNNGIGVISEILFYAAVIYDSCIAKAGLFSFGKYGKSSDTKDMIAIQNGGMKFERLCAHILAEKYHPLFSSEVDRLLRVSLASLGINFDRASYDYSKKVML